MGKQTKKQLLGPVRNPTRGLMIKILSVVFFIAVPSTIIAISEALDVSRATLELVMKVSVFGGFGIALMIYNIGRRFDMPRGEDVLADDPRPPVIYLRSFADDPKANGAEISLALVMDDVGPFVAIGEPDEDLPPLGASRLYVPSGNWKRLVSGLIKKASLVFMAAGRTPGLGWEVSRCRRLLDPAKLVILVPSDEAMYGSFVAQARASGTKIRFPEFPDRRARRIRVGGGTKGYFCGMVIFDSRWRGHFQPFSRAAFRGANPQIPLATAGRDNARLRLALQLTAKKLALPILPPGINFPYFLVLTILIIGITFVLGIAVAIVTGIISIN